MTLATTDGRPVQPGRKPRDRRNTVSVRLAERARRDARRVRDDEPESYARLTHDRTPAHVDEPAIVWVPGVGECAPTLEQYRSLR